MFQDIRLKARLIDSGNITESTDYPVGQSLFRIGRHPAGDLVISEGTVSGRHAVIEYRQGQYALIDQNSTNKTRLNGIELKPRKPYTLKNGDEIHFDAFYFIFELEEIKPPPPVTAPVAAAGPEMDDEATVFIEDEQGTAKASGGAPDEDETIFFDSEAVFDEEAGPTEEEGDDDETAFFDTASMLARKTAATVQPDEADEDETVFFDSEALLGGEVETGLPVAETDEDETVFLDDDAPAYDINTTYARKEPSAAGGRTKIGSYYVSNLLGKGGFGSVWKGMTQEGEPVAIKVLNPEVIENERAVRKFFHEAIILSKMDHPNICRFLDFFPYEGNYAIVMDFVNGVELKRILEEHDGPLPMEQACRIAAQALDAFHYAHMKEILHRDIKPENISVDAKGTAKVMDFGLAKLSTSESQQTSLFMISPRYTAPERFDANNTAAVDHRSDIYSLGLVFYEMFTGTHPFQTDSPTEMIVAHVNTVPTPPHEIADVSREISAAIMRAVAKDPADRFEDFGAFKMGLLNEPPRLSGESALELAGPYCRIGAKLFKGLAGAVKRYQKTATSFKVVQEGKEVTVVIKTRAGNSIRVSKNLDSF